MEVLVELGQVPQWYTAKSNSSISTACQLNNVPLPPTSPVSVTGTISRCALAGPQAFSLGQPFLELLERLLLLWAPAPCCALLDQLPQDGAGVGKVLDVAAVQVARPDGFVCIMKSLLGCLMSQLSTH